MTGNRSGAATQRHIDTDDSDCNTEEAGFLRLNHLEVWLSVNRGAFHHLGFPSNRVSCIRRQP